MHKKNMIHMVTSILLIGGGLNALIVGIFDQNLIIEIFGEGRFTKVIYILVGLSAVYEIFTHRVSCTLCATSKTIQ